MTRLRPGWIALLLFAGAFLLNSIGAIGPANDAAWPGDSIEGMEILNHRANLWSGAWAHKYPRVPFIVNALCYKPFVDRWLQHPVMVRESSGPRERMAYMTIPRITLLMQITRTLSALFGAGTVVAVFFLTRRMFQTSAPRCWPASARCAAAT